MENKENDIIVQEQEQRALGALREAEELRQAMTSSVPGNADVKQHLLQAVELYGQAISTLSRCLQSGLAEVPEKAQEVTRQRGSPMQPGGTLWRWLPRLWRTTHLP